MATYTGPKVRLSRQLGVAISDNPKHLNSRRLDTPPGGSAKRMRRLSDYGVRLREKQSCVTTTTCKRSNFANT